MPLIDRYDELPAADVKAALKHLLQVATSPAFGAVSKRELELALFEMLRELGLIEKRASLFSLMTELRVTREGFAAVVRHRSAFSGWRRNRFG